MLELCTKTGVPGGAESVHTITRHFFETMLEKLAIPVLGTLSYSLAVQNNAYQSPLRKWTAFRNLILQASQILHSIDTIITHIFIHGAANRKLPAVREPSCYININSRDLREAHWEMRSICIGLFDGQGSKLTNMDQSALHNKYQVTQRAQQWRRI